MSSVLKQTLTSPSESKPVGTATVSTVFAQLNFENGTGTLTQKVRLDISLGDNKWSSAHDSNGIIEYTPEQLNTLSNQNLIPAISYKLDAPGEVLSVRLVWLEGDGTLDITWRLA